MAGRKSAVPGELRSKRYQFLMTPSERKHIDRLAAEFEMPISDILRTGVLLFEKAKRGMSNG